MSKINETLVMMAEQKEQFEINGKKFQIIEVKEAEEQPDYSHLVGKWLRCIELEKGWNSFFEVGKWYKVEGFNNTHPQHKGFEFNRQSWAKYNFFDLSNPSDTNPDEKTVWEKANEDISNYMGLKQHLEDFGMDEKQVKHIVAYALLSEFADLCNEGRVVDWHVGAYCIEGNLDELQEVFHIGVKQHIAFLDKEARDHSFEVDKHVWNDYYGLPNE